MNNLIIIELIKYLEKNNNMSVMEDQMNMTLKFRKNHICHVNKRAENIANTTNEWIIRSETENILNDITISW